MDVLWAAERLTQNVQAIEALFVGVSSEQARWRPAPEKWSVLEIACHLRDEEREDFPLRIEYILQRPDQPLPMFDPVAWVVDRRYNEQDLEIVLAEFRAERLRRAKWLRGLEGSDWDAYSVRPNGSHLSAGDLLCSWLAHDQLHIRQIARTHHAYNEEKCKPYSSGYAGPLV